jgi:hypothetical protein
MRDLQKMAGDKADGGADGDEHKTVSKPFGHGADPSDDTGQKLRYIPRSASSYRRYPKAGP